MNRHSKNPEKEKHPDKKTTGKKIINHKYHEEKAAEDCWRSAMKTEEGETEEEREREKDTEVGMADGTTTITTVFYIFL